MTIRAILLVASVAIGVGSVSAPTFAEPTFAEPTMLGMPRAVRNLAPPPPTHSQSRIAQMMSRLDRFQAERRARDNYNIGRQAATHGCVDPGGELLAQGQTPCRGYRQTDTVR